MYFKLFSSCIPVRGLSRSTICDTQRSIMKFIPNKLYDILTVLEGKSFQTVIDHYGVENEKTIREYFDFLEEHEFIFWCDDPSLFPKIDTKPDSPNLIEDGIIEINRDSNHDFKKIFSQYDLTGCKFLEIRFYTVFTKREIINIIKLLDHSRIQSTDLLIKYNEDYCLEDINEISTSSLKINNIAIHSSLNDKIDSLNKNSSKSVTFYQEIIDSSTHCGNIDPKYFVVNQSAFFESLNYNTCLNKKISVDVNGNIKNCPSMRNTYGNIKNNNLVDALKSKKLRETWTINKDQIEICKDCEFRHICTDCRAFLSSDTSKTKPLKCTYNPKDMTWNN